VLGRYLKFHLQLLRAQVALLRRIGRGRTFNQKIAFKAAFDRREALTIFADKISARDYVARKVGTRYLAQAYVTTSRPELIDWDAIPSEFAMKANHGSGWNLIVSKSADKTVKLPDEPDFVTTSTLRVHPKNFDRQAAVNLANNWLKQSFWWYVGAPRIPEWAYKNIKPGILIEELLLEETQKPATDYKFHVFNGRCEYVNVINRQHRDEETGKIRVSSNVMNSSWEPVELVLNGNFPARQVPNRPGNFAEMLEVAEKLSSEIDYVRVDLYNLGGRIIFGELTNYPSAANNSFVPESFNLAWGKLLQLDSYKSSSKSFRY